VIIDRPTPSRAMLGAQHRLRPPSVAASSSTIRHPPLRRSVAAWREPTTAAPPPTAAAAPSKPPPSSTRQQQEQLLEQTAKHLLEINQRRADAEARSASLLRENRDLSQKLAELERRAEAEARAAAIQISRLSRQLHEQEQQVQAQQEQQAEAKAAAASVTIEYHSPSSWPRAFLHYCASPGGAWTKSPGVEMKAAAATGVFVLELGAGALPDNADSLEFALNDGGDRWDNGGGGNYRAALGGAGAAWRVRGGRVEEQQRKD
jgi:hypothetical protein